MPYRAPVNDLRFVLDHVVDFPAVAATARFAEASPETVEAILAEAGRLSDETLAPLNRAGDKQQAPVRRCSGREIAEHGQRHRAEHQTAPPQRLRERPGEHDRHGQQAGSQRQGQ